MGILNEKDLDNVIRNLENAKKRTENAISVADFHMRDLAHIIGDADVIGEELLGLYSRVRETTSGDGAALSGATAVAVAGFCEELCKRNQNIDAAFFLGDGQEPDNTRVAYMKNALSDEAYRIFSAVLKAPSVIYPSGFAAVCEEVYYGRCGYCMLPYETSEDGVLTGFTKLIRKYELCPNMICSVNNGSGVTKFVLLGRGQYASLLSVKGKRRYLKITVDSGKEYSFLKVTGAAALLDCNLIKTESAPVSWDDGRYAVSLTFDVTETDPTPFLLYLYLEVPECADKEIYTEII